jgi:hypothetical protein
MAAHTYDHNHVLSDEETLHILRDDPRRKPALAIGVLVAVLLGAVAATYFSYRGVAAPENPANARPALVDYH